MGGLRGHFGSHDTKNKMLAGTPGCKKLEEIFKNQERFQDFTIFQYRDSALPYCTKRAIALLILNLYYSCFTCKHNFIIMKNHILEAMLSAYILVFFLFQGAKEEEGKTKTIKIFAIVT